MGNLVLINLDPSRDTSPHVSFKKDKIQDLGLDLTCVVWTLPQSSESTPIETLRLKLRELNENPEVVGVCFISPLPKGLGRIDLGELCLLLDEKKDVEGLRNGSRQNVLAIGLVDYYLDKTGLSELSPRVVVTRCVDMITRSFIDTLSVRQYPIEVVLKPSPAEPEDESRAIWNDDRGLFQHKAKSIDVIDKTRRQLEEWKGQNIGKSPMIGLVIDGELPPSADIYIDLEYHGAGEPKWEDSSTVMFDGYPSNVR
ncbi:hypothetical protein Neosp_004123 [[Neocosmospora] mangrovei]